MQMAEKKQKNIMKSAPANIKTPEKTPVWFNEEIKREKVSKEEAEELEELMKGYK